MVFFLFNRQKGKRERKTSPAAGSTDKKSRLTINVEGRSVSMGGGGEASGWKAVRDRSSAQWPDTVKLEGLGINFIDFTDHPQATVRFFPNGTCDELIVILSNDQGECRMITWEVTTGLASVSTDRKRFGEL